MSQQNAAATRRLVTADMLAPLPEPAQRYLNYTGVVGQPWIDTVRVRYSGRFRLGAERTWMPIDADQVYTTNPPGFHWKARFKIAGLPLLRGDDTYKAGRGHMFGKLAGLYTVFDARGDELDQGTMMRYLNEMMWFPVAFLSDYITWQAVDDHAVDVTFTDGGKSVSARLFIDDLGRLMNFVAQRYREDRGRYIFDTWATPVVEYGRFAGLNLPARGAGVWYLSSGDLCYIDTHLDEVAYNMPVEAF